MVDTRGGGPGGAGRGTGGTGNGGGGTEAAGGRGGGPAGGGGGGGGARGRGGGAAGLACTGAAGAARGVGTACAAAVPHEEQNAASGFSGVPHWRQIMAVAAARGDAAPQAEQNAAPGPSAFPHFGQNPAGGAGRRTSLPQSPQKRESEPSAAAPQATQTGTSGLACAGAPQFRQNFPPAGMDPWQRAHRWEKGAFIESFERVATSEDFRRRSRGPSKLKTAARTVNRRVRCPHRGDCVAKSAAIGG